MGRAIGPSGGAGGVTSFNTRTGPVTAITGDYSAGMVGADPAGTGAAQASSAVGTHESSYAHSRIPTVDVAAALAGTSGTAPSASNKFVDNADTRLLSANEKAAMAGTSGTAPSASNKFVDNADPRLSSSSVNVGVVHAISKSLFLF